MIFVCVSAALSENAFPGKRGSVCVCVCVCVCVFEQHVCVQVCGVMHRVGHLEMPRGRAIREEQQGGAELRQRGYRQRQAERGTDTSINTASMNTVYIKHDG